MVNLGTRSSWPGQWIGFRIWIPGIFGQSVNVNVERSILAIGQSDLPETGDDIGT